MSDSLKEEIEYFEEKKQELLSKYSGKFVVIKGTEIILFSPTFEKAYEGAISKIGDVSFLIKEVIEKERIEDLPTLNTYMAI